VVARSPRHPREEGTDGVAAGFRRGSKLAHSPASSSTQIVELIADTEEVKETSRRVILQAQYTRRGQRLPKGGLPWVNLPGISLEAGEKFVRMKALHTSILEVKREGGKDDSIREIGQEAAIVCSKCTRSLQSVDKEQQTTPVWRKETAVQTESRRRISQVPVAKGSAAQLDPPSTRPNQQQKSAKAPSSTRRNPKKGHKKARRRTLEPVRS